MFYSVRGGNGYAEWCDGFGNLYQRLSLSRVVKSQVSGSVWVFFFFFFSFFPELLSGVMKGFFCALLSPFTHLFIISHTWGGGKPFYSHLGAVAKTALPDKGFLSVSLQASLMTADLDLAHLSACV